MKSSFRYKFFFAAIFIAAVFAFNHSSFIHRVQADDTLDISQVQIVPAALAAVASWPETTTVSVTDTGNGGVQLDFDKLSGPNAWQSDCSVPGLECGSSSNGVQYTIWVFRNVGGQWYGSGIIQAVGSYQNPTDTLANLACGGFYNIPQMNPGQDLQPGEQIGFMVSAGSERGTISTNIQERSNIQLYTVAPDNLVNRDPSCGSGGSGGSGSGTGGGTTSGTSTSPAGPGGSGIAPPAGQGAGTSIMSGDSGSIAFDSIKKDWLVVAANGGTISGQFMSETSKLINTSFTISSAGNAQTPQVAFSPDSKQFLAIWTTGSDVYGQLINEDGSLSGSNFKIAGGAGTFAAGTAVQYDLRNKRFVATWQQGSNIILATIDAATGTAATITVAQGVSTSTAAPSVAVDIQANQYCTEYFNGTGITLVPVAADTNAVGTASTINTQAAENVGIVYYQTEQTYLAAWQIDTDSVIGKVIKSCADDPSIDPSVFSNDAANGTIAYNSNTDTAGLLVQSSSNPVQNFLTEITGNGQSGSDQSILGGGSTASVAGGIAADTSTGMFGALAIQDGTNILGTGSAGSGQSSTTHPLSIPNSVPPTVPNQGLPTDLAQFIEAIFNWSLSILGIVIFARFFYAGFLWFTAAGNTSNTSKAIEVMKNAALGAAVLFSAYLILYTINPDLVKSTFTIGGLPTTSQPATGTGAAVTCNNGVCSNGFVGPCQTAAQCQPAGSTNTSSDTTAPTHLCGPDYTCTNIPDQGCYYESDCGGVDQYNCSGDATCEQLPSGQVGTYPNLSECQSGCEVDGGN